MVCSRQSNLFPRKKKMPYLGSALVFSSVLFVQLEGGIGYCQLKLNIFKIWEL